MSTNSNSSWVPDESSQTLFLERCWLQGVIVSAVAYGVTIFLYFASFHLLTRSQNRVDLKQRLPLLIYIITSFLLGTLFMVSLAAFTQMAFIDDRNYPGGPNAFENNMFSIPVDDSGNVAYVLTNWFSDALLVWRFKVIYQSCRAPAWIVMVFPCLIFLGSVAMGVMYLVQVSSTNPYVTNGANFTIPYLTISLALNILLTIAIVVRLLSFRNRIVTVLGPKHGAQYTSIASMIVESAAFYSALSIAFLVLFGIGNAVSQVFLQSLCQFQSIAAMLIVFRVAQGKGWTGETTTRVMTAPGSDSNVESGKMRFYSPDDSFTGLKGTGEMVQAEDGEMI